jgi:hypothetical protein
MKMEIIGWRKGTFYFIDAGSVAVGRNKSAQFRHFDAHIAGTALRLLPAYSNCGIALEPRAA